MSLATFVRSARLRDFVFSCIFYCFIVRYILNVQQLTVLKGYLYVKPTLYEWVFHKGKSLDPSPSESHPHIGLSPPPLLFPNEQPKTCTFFPSPLTSCNQPIERGEGHHSYVGGIRPRRTNLSLFLLRQ